MKADAKAGGRTLGGISERQLQAAILELAGYLGWKSYHTHDSRRSNPGFPDLVLARERVIFAELKSAKGQLRPEQMEWRAALDIAGAEYHVWRPQNWVDGDIEKILRRHAIGSHSASF